VYRYDQYDQTLVDERVDQFRDQTRRFLAGELSEDEFKPLRLQNGLYVQKHAPMLRIAIPYGTLSSVQLRALADIARDYDRSYGHFSTRQNLQLNWPELARVPDILADLAKVEMHGIQTSGNCVRNVTTDHFAGVAPDEITDPRPYCELLRQWSTFHPEFTFLPRKFKIAVSAAAGDRAAVQVHDIGLRLVRDAQQALGFEVWAGGGLGRTPVIGSLIRAFLPERELLNYVEAILRVYNRFGRRDNLYKARIKILVRELGAAEFAREVEQEWAALTGGPATLSDDEIARVSAYFAPPAYRTVSAAASTTDESAYETALTSQPGFAAWVKRCVHAHRVPGYAAVTISLKEHGQAPGDASSDQMRVVADAAEAFGFGEIRVTHHQNLVLPDVERESLPALHALLRQARLATPNIGLLTDIIACPGGDFCSLANAVAIPVAQSIQARFDDLDDLYDIGEIELNISGCINSCGHHHVGHIGILGVDKAGEEWYQVSLGGVQGPVAAIGRIIGPSFSRGEIPDVIGHLVKTYLTHRSSVDERFIDVVQRLGIEPFKEAVYGSSDRSQRAAA
jgi:sulfite reductase (NADPH) hemoprotein beta-component